MDWFDPDVPPTQLHLELVAYADGIRARVPNGWTVAAEGNRVQTRLGFHHPLSTEVYLVPNKTLLGAFERMVESLLTSPEFDVVGTVPAGLASVKLLKSLRQGIGAWGWTPQQTFEVCQTLAWVELIDWPQLEWLVGTGPPWKGWAADQKVEAETIISSYRYNELPDDDVTT